MSSMQSRCQCGLIDLTVKIAEHQSETGHFDRVAMCGKGLHEMTPENTGIQRDRGRTFCKACRRIRRHGIRVAAGKCPAGLHSWANPDNVYSTPTGQRRCRPCWLKAKETRAKAALDAAALAATYPEVERIVTSLPSRIVRPPGGVGTEADARYRLAMRVRGL